MMMVAPLTSPRRVSHRCVTPRTRWRADTHQRVPVTATFEHVQPGVAVTFMGLARLVGALVCGEMLVGAESCQGRHGVNADEVTHALVGAVRVCACCPYLPSALASADDALPNEFRFVPHGRPASSAVMLP
jgi:hypothetical protein